jgi:uncharacterized membrane protein YdbT with pleckstrin-like domain
VSNTPRRGCYELLLEYLLCIVTVVIVSYFIVNPRGFTINVLLIYTCLGTVGTGHQKR